MMPYQKPAVAVIKNRGYSKHKVKSLIGQIRKMSEEEVKQFLRRENG